MQLGVDFQATPSMSGANSLGSALSGAMGGGSNSRDAINAMKAQAYAESLAKHNLVYEQQAAKAAAETAAKQQETQFAATQAGRAQNAAGSAWAAEDERIKPAGIGVLAPGNPAIVQYDTNSKAIHDRLNYIYGNGDGNPEQRAGAANTATGGLYVQNGGANDFVRGSTLLGKPLDDKNLLPATVSGAAPVPVAAPAAASKAAGKPSAENLKAAGFLKRIEDANRIIEQPQVNAASQNLRDIAADYVPVVGRYFESENFKRLSDAEKDMVTAVLRDESGATIQDSEFARDADKYFPRYGDSQQVLADKANRRKLQIEAMRTKAGPMAPAPGNAAGPEVTGEVSAAVPDDLDAQAQAAIAAGADPAAVAARLKQLRGQ